MKVKPDSQKIPKASNKQITTMRYLNEITLKYPKAISFCSGRPADEFCVMSDLKRWLDVFQAQQCVSTLPIEILLGQYNRANGIITSLIAKMLNTDEAIEVDPDNIIVTVGAQEALTLVLMHYFNSCDDVLMVTDPCYAGVSGIASVLGIAVETVATDFNGVYSIDTFEHAIHRILQRGKSPRALYVVPDFDNPTGHTMPLAFRHELLALARQYKLIIVEDNPYGIFRYTQEKIPTIAAIDQCQSTLYVGTFSKTLFPGIRVGFLVVPAVNNERRKRTDIVQSISNIKGLVTVNTSPVNQAIVGGMLMENNYSLEHYNGGKIAVYQKRYHKMLSCLESVFGESANTRGISWTIPKGGFFLTVKFPFVFTNKMLDDLAAIYQVLVLPIKYFSLSARHDNSIRLSFSNCNESQIQQGIEQLGHFFTDHVPAVKENSKALQACK